MRESAQIDAIRNVILPERARAKPGSRPLRLWSAGCSTGEEAYSLAITVEEAGSAARASILATDICTAAISPARKCEYGDWSLRNDPDGRLTEYFVRSGDRLRLVERLRKRVRFEYLNLAGEDYPAGAAGVRDFDLILCRNVLIYFTEDHVKRVAQRLFDCLGEGGRLVTGPSDPPLCAPFQTVIVPGGSLPARHFRPRRVRSPFVLPSLPSERRVRLRLPAS